jgi:putative protease
MKLVTYLKNPQDLENLPDVDILLAPKELSRFGYLTLDQVNQTIKVCKRPILVWDILMTQANFQKALESLKKINLDSLYAIRVQDPGALNFLVENFPNMKIQLILENGNHNLPAISNWVKLSGPNLERIILSIELPKDILKIYIAELSQKNIKSELLGLGPILLFYSPRSLLNPLLEEKQEEVKALVSSSESPHKGFRVVENRNGTFMYNTKDHFILDEMETLKEIGLNFLRIEADAHLISPIQSLIESFSVTKLEEIKEKYPSKLMKGFFSVNKTDVLFTKLKNYKIARTDENYLGEVVDVIKKKLMGILLKNPNLSLLQNDSIEIKTPEGKSKRLKVLEIRNSSLEPVTEGKSGSIVYVSHLGGVSVRSAIFKV